MLFRKKQDWLHICALPKKMNRYNCLCTARDGLLEPFDVDGVGIWIDINQNRL